MPTGYTAAIADGITFEQYVWSCARAFGALVMMRDEPMDAPIPERFEPSQFYAKALAEARAEVARLEAMSPEEASRAALEEHAKAIARHKAYVDEKATLRMQYEDMRKRVEGWKPPTTDHIELRRFMLDQIDQSIDFDTKVYLDIPAKLDGEAWRAKRLEDCRRDIAYHAKNHAEEVARTESRNQWIKALRDSVPMPKLPE